MNYYELFSNKIHLHNTILQYIIYCYLLFKQNSILYRKNNNAIYLLFSRRSTIRRSDYLSFISRPATNIALSAPCCRRYK